VVARGAVRVGCVLFGRLQHTITVGGAGLYVELRRAVRNLTKVHFRYTDVLGQGSERTVWPLSLAYFGPVWVLAAWCELRIDFRTFRLDRMEGFAVTGERFRPTPGRTLHDFLKRSKTWTRGALTATDEGT
jgi:predicted DNA-binding transcriptional regulator YafY